MGRWVSDKEYWEDGPYDGSECKTKMMLVPLEPTDAMIDAALRATAVRLDIKGSQLTVNREKMRIRWRAMLAVYAIS